MSPMYQRPPVSSAGLAVPAPRVPHGCRCTHAASHRRRPHACRPGTWRCHDTRGALGWVQHLPWTRCQDPWASGRNSRRVSPHRCTCRLCRGSGRSHHLARARSDCESRALRDQALPRAGTDGSAAFGTWSASSSEGSRPRAPWTAVGFGVPGWARAVLGRFKMGCNRPVQFVVNVILLVTENK